MWAECIFCALERVIGLRTDLLSDDIFAQLCGVLNCMSIDELETVWVLIIGC